MKNWIYWRFKIFAITMELQYNGKNDKSQIIQFFLIKLIVVIKQTGLVLPSSICVAFLQCKQNSLQTN